jgi:hypothetical protein
MSAWVATGGVLLAIGCERNGSREPLAATAPGYGVMSRQYEATQSVVVDRLTQARCGRERRCDNVGDGRRYATYQACVDQVRRTVATDLNAYNCPRGIDPNGLDPCLKSLQIGDCKLSVNRLDQETNCRGRALCMK